MCVQIILILECECKWQSLYHFLCVRVPACVCLSFAQIQLKLTSNVMEMFYVYLYVFMSVYILHVCHLPKWDVCIHLSWNDETVSPNYTSQMESINIEHFHDFLISSQCSPWIGCQQLCFSYQTICVPNIDDEHNILSLDKQTLSASGFVKHIHVEWLKSCDLFI